MNFGKMRGRQRNLVPGVAMLVAVCAIGAAAQEVLAPPPAEYSARPPAYRATLTNQLATAVGPLETNKALLEWGPVQFRPHFLYRFLYGDGIPARPGQEFPTAIHEIFPGFLLDLGRHWRLDYTPDLEFYSSDHFRNTVNHAVALDGNTAYQDWTFGFSQHYVSSSQPLIETGSQTDQENHSTVLSADYHINSQMSLELAVNQNFHFVEQGITNQLLSDSRDWSTSDWLDYQFWPGFGAAFGIAGGYADVEIGSDMTFEQFQGRINWRPSDKLTFLVSGGIEDRQFLRGNASDLVNPIFGASLNYQPFEGTTLSLTANRTVNASYLVTTNLNNQVVEGTDVKVNLHQRLFHKLYLDVGGGYRNTSYATSAGDHTTTREDDTKYVDVRLLFPFLKRATAAFIYRGSDNTSSQSKFTYSSTQVGFELGYRF